MVLFGAEGFSPQVMSTALMFLPPSRGTPLREPRSRSLSVVASPPYSQSKRGHGRSIAQTRSAGR